MTTNPTSLPNPAFSVSARLQEKISMRLALELEARKPVPSAAALEWRPGVLRPVKSGSSSTASATASTTARTKAPPQQHTRNWKAYDKALKLRGGIMLYLPEEVLDNWAPRRKYFSPKRGQNNYLFTDTAILTSLTLGAVYNLPLRQTEGFIESILAALGREDLRVPDHTTLSYRRRGLDVSIRVQVEAFRLAEKERTGNDGPPRVVAIDSTGRGVSGPGSYRSDKWGSNKGDSNKGDSETDIAKRKYRKVHILTNPVTGEVTALEVTESIMHDASSVEPLLKEHHAALGCYLEEVLGDGAYEGKPTVKLVEDLGGKVTAPPQVNASLETVHGKARTLTRRDKRILSRRRTGSDIEWKVLEKYHRRSLAETTNSRLNGAFGGRFRSRSLEANTVEVRVQARALNLWRALEIQLNGGLTLQTVPV